MLWNALIWVLRPVGILHRAYIIYIIYLGAIDGCCDIVVCKGVKSSAILCEELLLSSDFNNDELHLATSTTGQRHQQLLRTYYARQHNSYSSAQAPVDAPSVYTKRLFSQKQHNTQELMTSPDDAAPVKPPPSFSPETPLVANKARFTEKLQSSKPIIPPLPDSGISSSASVPPSSSSSRGPSRSNSPNGRASHSTPHLARSSTASPLGVQLDGSDDIRSLIIRAFSPAIAVYASEDTEELVREKGFKNGFQELIRPFGETILGKIVIRDSIGSSRGWEDFGVRFVGLGAGNSNPHANSKHEHVSQIEEVLERHLDSADDPLGGFIRTGDSTSGKHASVSPFYKLFLRRLLSSTTLSLHETFAHPVACVIVISSRNQEPLESLRELYARTNQGDKRSPPWVHPEYLRYYVFVHDEDRDDIGRSTAIFDQMKRHFGLHCHLLRLRSTQCVLTDDDSVQFPTPEWISPSEDLSRMGEKGR